MPFTPYHFGPGLFVKGLAARWFSWLTFIIVQVAIDCETLYYIVRHEFPIHRALHTFVGATLTGATVAVLLLGGRRLVSLLAPNLGDRFLSKWPSVSSEFSRTGILTAGIIGGVSHPLLDALMHPDVRPFMPWTSANPVLNAVDIGTLHSGCIVTGVLGIALVGIWLCRDGRTG